MVKKQQNPLETAGLILQAQAITFKDDAGHAFSAGGDIRWRYVVTNNIFDFKDDSGVSIDAARYYRNRIRLWTKFGISDKVSAMIRITAEPWWGSYFKNDAANRWPLEFDNAYLDVKDAFVNGLNIRLGRQDIIYGDPGFLILDGTPADGSRTIFHDGVKLSYGLDEKRNTTVDLFGVIIEEGDYGLDDDWDIEGLYLTSKGVFEALPGHKLELYALRSHQGADTRNPDNVNEKIEGDDEDILGPGLRISGSFVDNLVGYAAEATYQLGGSDAVSRQGLGYYAHLTIHPGSKVESIKKYAPSLKVGYYFLSGDDPTTADTNEGFFHFTNQWPKYSELYIYPLLGPNVHEGAWWSNMSLIQAQVSCSPIAKLKVTGRLGIFGSEFEGAGGGTNRGTVIHARADYAFTPNISGQLLAEFFTPDDFYVDKDGASFLRAMTFVKF